MDEDYTFTLSGLSGWGGPRPTPGTPSAVTTTITDDDGAPTDITLTVFDSSLAESDSSTNITVTATLDGNSTRTEDTAVTLTLAGTATGETDYTVSPPIIILANTDSATTTLSILPADAIAQSDETILVNGSTTLGLLASPAAITLTDGNAAKLTLTTAIQDVGEGVAATSPAHCPTGWTRRSLWPGWGGAGG